MPLTINYVTGMRMHVFFQENANENTNIFSDMSSSVGHIMRGVCFSFLSDTSSCGHNWICRTYLAGTRSTNRYEINHNDDEIFHDKRV